jgi:hypothetical protein
LHALLLLAPIPIKRHDVRRPIAQPHSSITEIVGTTHVFGLAGFPIKPLLAHRRPERQIEAIQPMLQLTQSRSEERDIVDVERHKLIVEDRFIVGRTAVTPRAQRLFNPPVRTNKRRLAVILLQQLVIAVVVFWCRGNVETSSDYKVVSRSS